MQQNKNDIVFHTLDYLDKNASKKQINETQHFAHGVAKPQSKEFSTASSEISVPKRLSEETKKPKHKLNLKIYAEEISNIFKEEAARISLEEEKAEKEKIEKIARARLEEEVARERLKQEKALRERIEIEAARIRLEEEARARAEEAARIRLEEETRIRLEEEAARIRIEEAVRIRLAEETKVRLEEEEAARIRIEEETKARLEEVAKKENLNERFIDNQVHQIEEKQTNISYYAKKEPKALNENPVDLQNVVNNGDFVTFKDLQKHYVDFINKIQMQLASVGGGGEVLLKRLDDLDFNTFSDGYVIKYDQQTKKFYGAQESLSAEVLDGGEF